MGIHKWSEEYSYEGCHTIASINETTHSVEQFEHKKKIIIMRYSIFK